MSRILQPPPARPPVPRERLAAIERRKSRRRVVKTFFTVVLIILLTLVLISVILRENRPSPRFQFVQNGSIEHAMKSSALIIRDETVLLAPAEGLLKPLAAEGVRVSAGERIAMVIQPGMEKTLASLENCEQQISEIQLELMEAGNAAAAKAIYDETDADIASLVRLIRREASNGLLSTASLYESSLELLIEGRENRMELVAFKDARLDQLASQRSLLESQLGTNAGNIVSKAPGIVSFRMDGLESVLTPDKAATLTLDQYRDLLAQTKAYSIVPVQVAAKSPIGRISNGLIQYLAVFVRPAQPAWFAPGSLHSVSVAAEGIRLNHCLVVYAHAQEDGVFVIMSTDRQVARLFDRRVIACDITISSLTTTGLKLPVSAVTEEGDNAWIWVVHSGFARKAAVKVLDRDRSFVIIEPLENNPYAIRASSIVVVNPDSVVEGAQVG